MLREAREVCLTPLGRTSLSERVAGPLPRDVLSPGWTGMVYSDLPQHLAVLGQALVIYRRLCSSLDDKVVTVGFLLRGAV